MWAHFWSLEVLLSMNDWACIYEACLVEVCHQRSFLES